MRICVEGLDCVGKTTTTKYLCDKLHMQYLKIKKRVSSEGNQQEITQNIINEMSEKLGAWSGVLDRGYLSTVATGRMYAPDLNWQKLDCPQNLVPDFTVLMSSSKEISLRREKDFTKQDMTVLYGKHYELVQNWLVEQTRPPVIVIDNMSESLEILLSDIDKKVIPAIHTYVSS